MPAYVTCPHAFIEILRRLLWQHHDCVLKLEFRKVGGAAEVIWNKNSYNKAYRLAYLNALIRLNVRSHDGLLRHSIKRAERD